MRKLLLAATAMMGLTAGIANAQVTPPAVVVVPPPAPGASLPSQVGLPGTAVVRLNARFVFDMMTGSDSSNGYKNPTTGVAAKTEPYYFGEFTRLYPAFDGVTPNGIKYGAAIEIRQNSGGTGVNNSTFNNARSSGGTLYFRREMGYVGTDQLGTLRFGQTDGVTGLFMVGTFENVDYEGGWNGDLPAMFGAGSTLAFAFPDGGSWYETTKFTYLSPNFAGFDFGVSFEPSQQSAGDGACSGTTGNNTANLGCATVSTLTGPFATISPQLSQRRNFTSIMGRYRGTFGPVGVVVEGGWNFSGRITDANPVADAVYYKPMSFFDGGAAVTFGGLVLGGHVDVGSKNNNALLPSGAKDETSFALGGSYAIGPVIVGAQFINEQFQGSWNGTATTKNTLGMEHDIGIAVGADFVWSPGSHLYVDYLYGTRHQANRDFFAAATGKFNNSTRAQGFIIGQAFNW